MRILFDQGTPVPLRRHLHPHDVDTAWPRIRQKVDRVTEAIKQMPANGYQEIQF